MLFPSIQIGTLKCFFKIPSGLWADLLGLLSGHHKAPQPGWLGSKGLICPSSGAWGSEVMLPAEAVSQEGCLLPVSSHGAEGKGAPRVVLFQGGNPIRGGPTLMTESPPQVPPAQHRHLKAPYSLALACGNRCAYGGGGGHPHLGVETWL